ncbi:MAG: hypothetical protein DBY32_03990 [Phascolarctobacterium sp.]|nr:MAG: hypothetical protein DBY32_03990 [Phascolarctobacterium sp.]
MNNISDEKLQKQVLQKQVTNLQKGVLCLQGVMRGTELLGQMAVDAANILVKENWRETATKTRLKDLTDDAEVLKRALVVIARGQLAIAAGDDLVNLAKEKPNDFAKVLEELP